MSLVHVKECYLGSAYLYNIREILNNMKKKSDIIQIKKATESSTTKKINLMQKYYISWGKDNSGTFELWMWKKLNIW